MIDQQQQTIIDHIIADLEKLIAYARKREAIEGKMRDWSRAQEHRGIAQGYENALTIVLKRRDETVQNAAMP